MGAVVGTDEMLEMFVSCWCFAMGCQLPLARELARWHLWYVAIVMMGDFFFF